MLKKDRIKRKLRIRSKVVGTSLRPRLSVYRSNKYVYAQVIDDTKAHTLCESHGANPTTVGEEIAKLTLKSKISTVVFDRNGYIYHGRIKQIADAARSNGLKF